MRPRYLNHLYLLLTIVEGTAVVVSPVAAGTLRADAKQLQNSWSIFASPLVWVQNRAWIFIMAATGCIVVAQLFRHLIGPPWVWDAVHRQLDLFQEYAFPQHGVMLHENRVTLFKHVRWRWCFRRWPWSGWLVPVERSGHMTRKTSAAFRVPDNANDVEGIAGATWAGRGTVSVDDLPDLSGVYADDDIRIYAERTFVKMEWVRNYINRRRPLARSFVGIPVEVKGRRWGVIVLDSKSEMRSPLTTVGLYTLIARLLATLLEKA